MDNKQLRQLLQKHFPQFSQCPIFPNTSCDACFRGARALIQLAEQKNAVESNNELYLMNEIILPDENVDSYEPEYFATGLDE